jgi:alanine racemase
MAVVKADGYGHGACTVARAAVEAGAEWLGTTDIVEASERWTAFPLRDAVFEPGGPEARAGGPATR